MTLTREHVANILDDVNDAIAHLTTVREELSSLVREMTADQDAYDEWLDSLSHESTHKMVEQVFEATKQMLIANS